MIYVGVDYSITCPAVCVHSGDEWDNENVSWYLLSKFEKNVSGKCINFVPFPETWETETERFLNLSKVVSSVFSKHSPENVKIMFEDYSFGSKGRVFHIAEATGISKLWLHTHGFSWETFAPTSLKKWATGKGNAKKPEMCENFEEMYGKSVWDFWSKKRLPKNPNSPLSDMVDSYFLCRYLFSLDKSK